MEDIIANERAASLISALTILGVAWTTLHRITALYYLLLSAKSDNHEARAPCESPLTSAICAETPFTGKTSDTTSSALNRVIRQEADSCK
jgi:hypothetical protein